MSRFVVVLYILVSILLTTLSCISFFNGYSTPKELVIRLIIANIYLLVPLVIKLFNIKF